eukprot:TRINITY_DN447_c0_g1_i4.p1 TRINITY_DN447_c0_g1~~TRINITY_DN447_c0_g1_i4.p1  ORF type:complete len:603 (-),score=79.52 TRINITY_DN447_c0_g1_i4:487-2295(-)
MQQSACFSSCRGGLIAMAATDGTIVIWHAISCKVVNNIQGPPDCLSGVCLSKDGKFLACSYMNKVVVWDIKAAGGSIVQQLDTTSIFLSNLAFSENSLVLLGYSVGGGILVWDWRIGKQLFELSHGALLKNAFLSEDGRCLFLCTSDAKVATIDLSTRNMYGGINLQEHVQSLHGGDTNKNNRAGVGAGDGGASTQSPLTLSQDLLDILLQDGRGAVRQPENPQTCVNKSNIGKEGSPPLAPANQSHTQVNFSALPTILQRQIWCMADFQILKKVYKGKNSRILHAQDRISGMHVAIKSYDVSQLSLIEQTQVAREVRLHSNLTHPNVIRLFAAWLEGHQLNLVMDYAIKGDLYMFQRNCKGGTLCESIAVPLILDPLLSALQDLHANGIIHRDLKPENVLFDDNFQVKLCDFGLAINARQETPNTRLGTVDYVAPEILDCPVKYHPFQHKDSPQQQSYNSKVDVWALGILTYELLVGVPPFEGNCDGATLTNIRAKSLHIPEHVLPAAREFIQLCLNKNPLNRPAIETLYNHHWLQQYRGLSVPSTVLANLASYNTLSAASLSDNINAIERGWLRPPYSGAQLPATKNAKNLLKIPGVTAL